MSELFNAADIVGKTLIAKRDVYVYRNANEGAEVTGVVKSGQPVGVVYAWLSPSAPLGRSGLWWAFFPQSGQYYYTPQIEGAFDVTALNQQGVISTAEKIEQQREQEKLANQAWYVTLLKTSLPWVAGIAIAVAVAPELIKGVFKRK